MSVQTTNLLIYLKQIGPVPGCRALHFHFSALPKAVRTRDNLTRAIGVLNDLSRRSMGNRLFLMKSLDVVYVSFGQDIGLLRQTTSNIHKLFGWEQGGANVYGTEDFVTILELDGSDTRLLTYAESLFSSPPAETPGRPSRAQGSVQAYLQVMERIGTTDISTILLSQPAYATVESGKLVPVFNEMYVSIKALEDAFCPGASLVDRRTLFVELTEQLDRAVLKVVRSKPDFGQRGVSLNLNLATVQSEVFGTFDSHLSDKAREKVVLEFHRNDVVANFDLFRRLAPDLAARGYSLCLDALDVDLLPHLDLKGLNCRFAKLFWSPAAAAAADSLRDQLAERLSRDEGVRYILARCDNAAALRLAKHAGLSLLQGKLIDHMARHGIPV